MIRCKLSLCPCFGDQWLRARRAATALMQVYDLFFKVSPALAEENKFRGLESMQRSTAYTTLGPSSGRDATVRHFGESTPSAAGSINVIESISIHISP